MLVGFDGFVDEIVTPVAARHGPAEDYVPFASIADFAEPIASAGGGRNANIEVAPPWKNLGAMGRKAIDMDEGLGGYALQASFSREGFFRGISGDAGQQGNSPALDTELRSVHHHSCYGVPNVIRREV